MVTAVIDESHDWWMSHPSVHFTAQDHTPPPTPHPRPSPTHTHTHAYAHTNTRILFELYSNLAAGIQDKD